MIGKKLKEQIMHIKELCKQMEMETTIRNCSPTFLVMPVQLKLKKIRNKVTIETGFPSIITIMKVEGST